MILMLFLSLLLVRKALAGASESFEDLINENLAEMGSHRRFRQKCHKPKSCFKYPVFKRRRRCSSSGLLENEDPCAFSYPCYENPVSDVLENDEGGSDLGLDDQDNE